ncbi:hypothetical protein MIND_01197400 [Mycena indigotica]|uniref:Protein kinase domain-containing protein n=1 Tax=Mycena indigotica TaxID=2126181 RepID=A0A8H6VV10_9AGAR|nr:uncharacterized protein MIND_01197400 [Mycena indigotica]KAF7292981.1 hypothetical protein MIND_01197400 [Mycena indigotica]
MFWQQRAPRIRLPTTQTQKESGVSLFHRRGARHISVYQPTRSQMALDTRHAESVPHQYSEGQMLQLSLSLSKASSPQKISVRVLQAFRPFTFSQVVVAEPQSGFLPLPPRFVIKFSDPRHIPNRIPLMRELDQERSTSPWSPRFRDFFTTHLREFRTKRWPNHWKCTGATQPVTREERMNKDEDFYDDWLADREGTFCLWSQEMDHWEQTFESHSNEMAVYHALESLQGRSIPRLIGSGTYKPPIYGFDDPLLSSVPFLALEYIPGARLDHIQLAATISPNPSSPPQITPPNAKRAAHAIIDVARAIRNLGVNNPDFAARNIILRDLDPLRPVIIDFGLASTAEGLAMNLQDIRNVLYDIKWNIPSPYRLGVQTPHPYVGYAPLNGPGSDRKIDILNAYFEEIAQGPSHIHIDEETGRQYVWEAPRWRLKEGVRTCDEDVEWGRTEEAIRWERIGYPYRM